MKQKIIRSGLLVLTALAPGLLPVNGLLAQNLPERKFAFYPSISFCGTSYLDLFSNMGDVSGAPLELKFHDDTDLTDGSEAWKKWHTTVAEAVNLRFSKLPQRFDANGKLVVCRASFRVSSKREISSIQTYMSGSGGENFQKMVKDSIKQLEGNSVLTFPPNSDATHISKYGRFSQNYGIAVIAELKRL